MNERGREDGKGTGLGCQMKKEEDESVEMFKGWLLEGGRQEGWPRHWKKQQIFHEMSPFPVSSA